MTVAMIPGGNNSQADRAQQQDAQPQTGAPPPASAAPATPNSPQQNLPGGSCGGMSEKDAGGSSEAADPDIHLKNISSSNSGVSVTNTSPNLSTTSSGLSTGSSNISGSTGKDSSSSSCGVGSDACSINSSEPDFPHSALAQLDEMIHRQRWVVPVLPECELEILLDASIALASKGLDTRSEACQRFFREGLTLSFTKILTDEAVSSWKFEIHKCILSNCEKLVELIVLKLPHDWFPLLELLAMLFNPSCKFHTFNTSRTPDSIPPSQKLPQHQPVHPSALQSSPQQDQDTFSQPQSSPSSSSLPSQQQSPQSDLDQGGETTPQSSGSTSSQPAASTGNPTTALPGVAVSQTSSSDGGSAGTAAPVLHLLPHERVYARPSDYRHPKGWLVDLVNYFGRLGGFDKLLERFQSGRNLSVPVMCALLRPFGFCYEFLTVNTIETFFMPIIDLVPTLLENLTDDELKKEAKIEAKNDALSTIIKAIKALAARIPSRQDTAKNLEIFRLKMILRLLQISSFNGKMNALNEVNKVINNVNYPVHRHAATTSTASPGNEEEDWLTARRFAEWIKDNRVLQIVLRDSLHQPQYVEKLEKIIRFVIKERALSLSDLDDIWQAQHGKHEAIVKNVHDLLAKLAWDFSPEQLDHLFEHFQTSWREASKKQREKLLELIRRLAEDDKDGDMAQKVLSLLWSLARSADVPTEIMDQALSAHVKILDYSCAQERDLQKQNWLKMCVEELRHDKWVLPALKQIREIFCSYNEAPANYPQHRQLTHASYRHDVISKLQNEFSLVVLVTENLTAYMKQIAIVAREKPGINPTNIIPDGRYNHVAQVQDRLSFLRFLLKDGQLWLCAPQAKQIWNCLAENAVFTADREACFKWFSKLMGDEPDLDPDINKEFFESNILLLDPKLLTEHGMRCFDRFFKAVNFKENKLVLKRRTYLMDDVDLIGIDYLWKVLLSGSDEMANRAIELLKETFTNLGPRLLTIQAAVHEDFINNCISRLKAMSGTVSCLNYTEGNSLRVETTRMCRVLKVLYEYVVECDGEFGDERAILPLARSWRGKHMSVTVRFQSQTRQPDELELWTHTNDTVGSLRRQVMQRLKAAPPNVKVEMYLNNELMDPAHDNRVIAHVPLKDKMVLTGKLAQVGNNLPSSPDSSSDSSPGSPHHQYDGPNNEAENCLPGVLLARNLPNTHFLIDLADLGCRLQLAALRDAARALLSVVPADQYTVNKLSVVCQENAKSIDVAVAPKLEEIFFFSSSSTVLYNLQVLYSMLMPASNPLNEKAIELQFNFIMSGGVKLVIDMLTKNSFLSKADVSTRRAALLLVVKIAKLVFVTVGYAFVGVLSGSLATGAAQPAAVPALNGEDVSPLPAETPGHGVLLTVLQQALPHIPSSVGDCMIRSVAVTLSKTLLHNVTATPSLWAHFTRSVVPDHNVVNSLLRIVWSSSAGLPHLVTASLDHIQHATETLSKSSAPSSSSLPPHTGSGGSVGSTPNSAAASGGCSVPEAEDLQLCSEGLETLAVVLMLCPNVLEKLSQEAQFQQLVVYLVAGSCERSVRQCAVDQLLLIATKCASSSHTLVLFIAMLFNMLSAADSPHQHQPMPHVNVTYTKEFFQLLCGLLSCACVSGIVVNDVEVLLDSQVLWLRNVARNFRELSAAAAAAAVTAAAEDSAALSQSNNSGGPPHGSDSSFVTNDRAAALARNAINSPSTSTTPYTTLTAGTTTTTSSSGGVAPPPHHSPGSSPNLPPSVDHTLLEGHLCVTRELLAFLTPEAKFHIGGDPTKGICLIREIIEDFIFPFSKVYLQLEHSTVMPAEQVNPVCSTQSTVIAAYDLLVTLCTGCALNLTLVAEMLTRMFYSENEESLTEWDYMPAVGPRPPKGFVGLKNAGATCYMNSVLQQLYMIRQVREGVLCVEGAATDPDEDFSGEERVEPESTTDAAEEDFRKNAANSNDQSRKEYHIGILKQVQAIFAHLSCSKLQYYVPRGLWKHFKLQGEPVNLREQHDACEFYNILVESINEALKALGRPQLLNTYLGGSFSDQKICKTCPHRYSREEAFTVISIDIRNYSNLYDSLEQYVKGDLLEGDNAYLCEKCDKKVDTVKRICLKKLPPILAIQLKRFDYDWERETSVKFNDYFEFPRELDMDPYTVQGLARNGELIAYDESDLANEACSRYQLTGIVVHSGQASGGHYYSYIGHRNGRECKWYKFDDGEVTECRMDDDEEMKNQCFGGEYLGEQIFDNMMKRVSYRRQKRWWNAYLLFYTREDVEKDQMITAFSEVSIAERPRHLRMPLAMQRSVARQNVRFMHSRSQFSLEYFHFLKKLLLANHSFILRTPADKASEAEQVGLVSTKLASKFLFMIGLHTKKLLRGPAQEWYDALQVHLRSSARSRVWFVKHVLFGGGFPFSEYLLECPSLEVRLVFSKMVVAVAHSTRGDPPLPGVPLTHNTPATAWASLSDQVLAAVLMLVHRELTDHTRHLAQYFHLFNMYAALGVAEKRQLLKLNVVENLMGLAVEEAPGPVIKYPCVDLSKLYQVVSQLVRCCDVSMRCRSSMQNHPSLANPHGDQMCSEPLMPIQARVAEILYSKPTYIKKVIEEAHNSDDTVKLLRFCCWENPNFSSIVLSELLSQVGYAYTYEMRPFIDLLLHMLTLEDSWQEHRIHNALKGIQEEREGLLDVVHRSKNHYQKRAYQCVKCMVTLFSTCHAANLMLNNTPDLKQRFAECVEWLNEEMNRRPFSVGNQQYYNNWSPPAPSNETSNGYYLERSVSARNTLDKAMQMCPDEEGGDEEPDESVHTSAALTASDNNNRVSSGKAVGSSQQSPADDAAPTSRTAASPTNTDTAAAPSGGAPPSQPTVTAQVEDHPPSVGGGPVTEELQIGSSGTPTQPAGDGTKTLRLTTTTTSSSSGVTKDSNNSSGPPGQ